ncbi:hypothetical protein CHE218_11310 [Microbacterium sp. che218]
MRHRAHDEVRRIARHLGDPFALDLDLEAVALELLDDEFVVDAQCEAEGVEAGPEVRAGGGDPDGDPTAGA